ncbi:uncharacterized protein LOC142169556 [Nicotiana tabacum]|uniref:Uncharacterized protein LOC142169556 n=1 Tax=Nicotiana tabacum TaxID=4097 RepID=A0AC58SRC4_TOBAC
MAIDEKTSGSSTGITIDHHHPVFLQPCDTPGSSLISIQLKGTENYALWSRSMKIGLIVLSWIMNAVSSELFSGIVYKSSAHKVWTDLKDKYDKVDGSRIFYLHKEIATLSQGISSVSAHFAKLTDLWEEYDALTPYPGCDCPESKSYAEHFEY